VARVRIGEVAERSGVSVRALRYYEEQHLLEAGRSASGQRRYTAAAVERVQLIQLLYAAGLSSASILRLLPCVESGTSSPEVVAHLLAERARIDAQVTALTAARDRLDEVIAVASDPAHTCSAAAPAAAVA
jgi:DNA-binding transcriptional MerR regulator